MRLFLSTALIALTLSIPMATALAGGKPQVWFCALDPRPGYGGAPGYMDLFKSDAPWQNAASHVDVFKIYPQWIHSATDAQLQTQFADLKRRHIALALEFGVLTGKPGKGQGVEGQGGEWLLRMARRVRDNGGELRYIAMDEPTFFGTVYNGKNAFALSVDEMAQNAAANIKEMWTEFPDVQVGDIEPLVRTSAQGFDRDQLLQRYGEADDALGRALGRPLAFFQADIDWNDRDWPTFLSASKAMAGVHKLPFGVIYNGQGETGNLQWVDTARRRTSQIEDAVGTPEIVVFQSWNPFPNKLLPETDADAMTSLIDDYFATPTRLTATFEPGFVRGELVTRDGRAVPGASVRVAVKPRSTPGIPATYAYTGAIPEGATFARLGIRVNTEGATSGDCDVRVAEIRLEIEGQPPVVKTFGSQSDLNFWAGFKNLSAGQSFSIEDGQLHVVSPGSFNMIVNSNAIPLPASGSGKLVVRATIPSASIGTGYFALIFLNEKKEIARTTIPFDVPTTELPTALTGPDGRWRLPVRPGRYAAHCVYDGDSGFWPAEATVDK